MPARLAALTALALFLTPGPADACSPLPDGWFLRAVDPAVGELMPANGAIVLAGQVHFPFDFESIVDEIVVELTAPDGEPVPGELRWAPTGEDLVWWPDAALTPGAAYVLDVGFAEEVHSMAQFNPIEGRKIVIGPATPGFEPGRVVGGAAEVSTEGIPGGCISNEHFDSCGDCFESEVIGERTVWQVSVVAELPAGPYADARRARMALGTSPGEARAILARTPVHRAEGAGRVVFTRSAGELVDWPHGTACAAVEVIDPVDGPVLDGVSCFEAPVTATGGALPIPGTPIAAPAATGCSAGVGGGTSAWWMLALLLGVAGRRRGPLLMLAAAAIALGGCDAEDECVDCDRPPPPGFELPTLEATGPTPPPLLGGALAVHDGIAVVGDVDRSRVVVVDIPSRAVLAEHHAGEPGRVLIADGRAYVTLRTEGALLVLDLETGAAIARHPVCAAPRGVAHAWDALHVACAGGALVSLDESGRVTRRLPLAPDLRDVVFADDLLHISRFRQPELISIDRDGAVVARRAPRARDALGGVVPSAPTVAWRTLALPSGQVVMLHQRARLDAIPTAQPGGYGGGGFGCDGVVTTELTAFPPLSAAVSTPRSIGLISQAVVAIDMTFIEGQLAITAPGNGQHTHWHTGRLTRVDLANPETWGGCIDVQGQLRPENRGPRRHIAIAEHQGRVIGLLRDSPTLADIDGNPWVELGGEPVRNTGRDLFHADVGRGIACASCHPEGSEDGHAWLFLGHGLRRTQELRGGLAGTAPFHWTGDMSDMQHLMDEVMTHRMGGPTMPTAYTDALMTWIDAQPVDPVDPIAEGDPVAGALLFEDGLIGCAGCHSGPRYSDDVHYDVGTGGLFVTPTLLGIGRRGTLMHDGCGTRLADRFDPGCGGGEQHGRTAHLSADQIRDLTAYLATL